MNGGGELQEGNLVFSRRSLVVLQTILSSLRWFSTDDRCTVCLRSECRLHSQNNTVIVGPAQFNTLGWEFWPGSLLVPIGMDLRSSQIRQDGKLSLLCLYEEVIWSATRLGSWIHINDGHNRSIGIFKPAVSVPCSSNTPTSFATRVLRRRGGHVNDPGQSQDPTAGLTRHWWLILLVWLCLSLPAMYLIHQLVEPTFEASSILRITPTSWTLYEPSEQIDFRGADSLPADPGRFDYLRPRACPGHRSP